MVKINFRNFPNTFLGWNIMDGTLVFVSLVDLIANVIFGQKSKIFDILRVFRLVRALRPLRVINR